MFNCRRSGNPILVDGTTEGIRPALDIFWLKDESLEDSDNLPDPVVLAREIVESLETALEQFRGIGDELEVGK